MKRLLLALLLLWPGPAFAASINGGGSGSGLSSGSIDTCAELATIMGDETGTCGGVVLSTAPTITSPVIATKINVPRGTAFPGTPATGDTIVITDDSATGACDSAAGSAVTLCYYTGATWAPLGDGGAGGTAVLAASTFGTDNVVVRSDGTSRGAQASGCTISDANLLTCPGGFAAGSGSVGVLELLEGTAPGAHGTASTHNLYINSTGSVLETHENGGSAKTYLYSGGGLGTPASGTLNTTSVDITIPKRVWLPAAGCNNATAGSVWDLPTTNAPAAACITGTNTQKGVLDFDQTTDESAQVHILLPSTWTGAIDANVLWLSGTTTGSVAWCVQLVSSADAETDDPAFPAQATGNCVSDAAKGTTNQLNVAALTGLTITGVAAGELLHIQISRDPNETSTRTDDHAADARLVGVELIYRVTE